jgi:hypothetical protein
VISGVSNKRDLGRQREDRIFVTEEEILHEIENQPRTSTRSLANHLGVSQFVVGRELKKPLRKFAKQSHSESNSAFLGTWC